MIGVKTHENVSVFEQFLLHKYSTVGRVPTSDELVAATLARMRHLGSILDDVVTKAQHVCRRC